jgi:hypothetical protein
MSDQNNQFQGPGGVGRVNYRPEPYGQGGNFGEQKPWWQKISRRGWIIGGAAVGLGTVGACSGLYLLLSDGGADVDKDSLDLQKAHGWNVGSENRQLPTTYQQQTDSLQTENWRTYLDQNAMLTAFQPKAPNWMPFFVPTLIQSLQYETLKKQLTPIFSPDMQESYLRGQAVGRDFLKNAQNAGETAIIVDLPGRAAVAFGAGLASYGRLITTFDNYPHPLGVTPSHETLEAMLYYAAEIAQAQDAVPAAAPPIFLLDSNRLNAYADADNQFDNRYLAKIPGVQKLQEAGIKNVLYVIPDRTRKEELDDINEDFVEYKAKGLNVAMLPASDFQPATATQTAAGTTTTRTYYYGGNPLGGVWFFYSYPFYSPYPTYVSRYPAYRSYASAPPAIRPPSYAPVSRPTLFSGTRVGSQAGIGRSKPSGFGRSTVRMSSNGQVTGTRAGRSGSFGRSGGFFGG